MLAVIYVDDHVFECIVRYILLVRSATVNHANNLTIHLGNQKARRKQCYAFLYFFPDSRISGIARGLNGKARV